MTKSEQKAQITKNQREQFIATYHQRLAEIHSAFQHILFLRRTTKWSMLEITFMYRTTMQFYIDMSLYYHPDEFYT